MIGDAPIDRIHDGAGARDVVGGAALHREAALQNAMTIAAATGRSEALLQLP